MVIDGSEKIPFCLTLSELVLDDAAPTRPFIDTLMFWYIKGVHVIHIWAKFHLCLICRSRVLKFHMFSYSSIVNEAIRAI